MPGLHMFLLSTILIIFGFIVFESLIAVIDVYLVIYMKNYWDTLTH